MSGARQERDPARVARLPDVLVNQIAAGEVIERPAAAVKELVENALDAGATRVAVALHEGGIARIAVEDDGCGIASRDLRLAVERHCTSKLTHRDLTRIATLGFRGEALPSIGAAARLAIVSRARGADTAWRITVAGGVVTAPAPTGGPPGTLVLVEDLFFATPARRKFLKSARIEADHVEAALRRLAFAFPRVAFRLLADERVVLDLPAGSLEDRACALLGPASAQGLLPVEHGRDALLLAGYTLGPAASRATPAAQFLVVNDRPVTDPLLRTAVRVAFRDVIERGRHAACALSLRIPADEVDVNVHPAKTELRFRDPEAVRALLIGGLRRALGMGAGAGSNRMVSRPGARPPMHLSAVMAAPANGFAEASLPFGAPPAARLVPAGDAETCEAQRFPLGAPVAQVLDTYVIAVAGDGDLVLVDQHAAHERLTHERLRAEHASGAVRAQALLLPEVVELPPAEARALGAAAGSLATLGLELEPFGAGAVLVRAVPALLGSASVAPLLRDVAEGLLAEGEDTALPDRLDAALARMACHGSIRAGRRLGAAEMSALLRAMEATPRAATCSHGRPTYLKLARSELERMFGRG